MPRKLTSENDLVVSAGGAAVPARRKAAPRPRAKRAAVPAETLTPAVVAPEIVTNAANEPAEVYTPSHEEIARLAYTFWEARGCQGGSPEEDWLRAEAELRVQVLSAIA
jgi:hypothetical protein